jgi:SAM-dependent methyltransferase
MTARYQRVVVDIGTGTGQAVLRRARREPDSLVIGLDADARTMNDASRRAAASVTKGGLPNALFLVESAERLPGPLSGRADLVTVVLPWGSLLRAILGAEREVIAGLCALLRSDGELLLFLSELDSGGVGALLAQLGQLELATLEVRQATADDVRVLSSGWARRLGIPGSRPAWIVRLQRQRPEK